ncbi:MAG: DegT/DnrJ/EryC1/StrS family aminotransferase [Tepidisphaeraceae bacterium]
MTIATTQSNSLAILGGPKSVEALDPDLFKWPIVTREDEDAVVAVLREGTMSGVKISKQFEAEWGQFIGTKFNLCHPNGTASLLGAFFGCGLGRGDELISPSLTYWATAMPCMALGATPVFADIEKDSICIDPKDIEHRITPRTKAIVVVHYSGHPCDMDAIMTIARKHNLKVIEDVSHAHGARYKGKMTGTIGDVACYSMMAGKSFPIGEGGMLSTDDRTIYERALAFGHYERMGELTLPDLRPLAGMPLGGVKHRINQTASAMGRVQLKHYPERIAEIQRAMNRFWDSLEGVPGLRPHRVAPNSDSTMGGWYNPLGHYLPEELNGLPVAKFIEAVNAEGGRTGRTANKPMHVHPALNMPDVYHDGKPTRIAFSDRDVRQGPGSLPVSEALAERVFGIPWFKKDRPEQIERYAMAYRKVALNAKKLL